MVALGTPCEFDFDCPIPGSLCYSGNVSWLESENVGTGICLCNAFFGFEGENCTEFGITAKVEIASLSVELLIALLAGFTALWHVLKLLYLNGFNYKKVPSSVFITALSVTCGLLAFSGFRMSVLLSTLNPKEFNTRLSDDEDAEKFSWLVVPLRFFVFFTMLFTVIANLHISVLWVEVGYRTKTMKGGAIDGVTYYKNIVRVIELIFALIMAGIAIFGFFNFATVVAFPFMLIILVAFLVGRHRMTQLLNQAISMHESNDLESTVVVESNISRKTAADRMRRTLRSIRLSSTCIILSGFFLLFNGIGYFLLDTAIINPFGHREFCPALEGSFCYVSVTNLGIAWGILGVLISVFFYTIRTIRKMIRKEKEVSFSTNSAGVSPTDDESNIQSFTSFQQQNTQLSFNTDASSPKL